MKKLVMAGAAALMLSGCTTAEQGAVGGAAVGAAVGGLATGRVEGALAGAAIGGASGYLLGRAATPGYCRYRDQYGRVYEARC